MISVSHETLVMLGTVASTIVAAYLGFKQISKKSDTDLQTTIIKENSDLRDYLSNELRASTEHWQEEKTRFEKKIKSYQIEVDALKRANERLYMEMLKAKIQSTSCGSHNDIDCPVNFCIKE